MASVLNGLFLFLQGHFSLHLELTQETKRIRLKISCLVTCAERHSHRFWGQDLEISLKWPIHPLYQARAHSGPSLQPRPHQHLDFRAIHVGAEPPGMGVPSTSHWGVALSPSVFSLLLPPSTAGFRCRGQLRTCCPAPTHPQLFNLHPVSPVWSWGGRVSHLLVLPGCPFHEARTFMSPLADNQPEGQVPQA